MLVPRHIAWIGFGSGLSAIYIFLKSSLRGQCGTMENSYGIGVENKYSLFLDDESDPFEALANAKKETEKKVKASGKENKSAKTAGTKTTKKVAVKEKVPEKSARPGRNALK